MSDIVSCNENELLPLDMSAKLVEPCEDAISRTDLIRKLQAWDAKANGIPNYAWGIIKELPSVTPKEKVGHWIYDDECKEHGHCDICGFKTDLVDGNPHNYCRSCGARMESET